MATKQKCANPKCGREFEPALLYDDLGLCYSCQIEDAYNDDRMSSIRAIDAELKSRVKPREDDKGLWR